MEQVDYSIPQFFSDYLYSYNKTTRDFDLRTVDSSELYSTKFINKYTKFSCHDEFFNSSPFAKKPSVNINNLTEAFIKKLDKFTQENTSFNSFEDMHDTAVKYWEERIYLGD
ncbi:hypothetical protein [Cytobacillus sp. IB215316]|uniref:hypothetical protein n=1 Tax=Cytobacillus sp. IB215316 TaxID=3097354 RepID=UPI002A0D4990|nr:hypothetical protein [Cytobacillus sp. IB215316]MDX8360345.1 hypothetical protein [Cytobacillus sp. IB215316]